MSLKQVREQLERDLTSQESWEVAKRLYDRHSAPGGLGDLFAEAWRYQQHGCGFGFSQFSFERLIDRNNWTSERPAVRIEARINQLGNLTVEWFAAQDPWRGKVDAPLDFDSEFLRESGFHFQGQRPWNELMWFKGVRSWSLSFTDATYDLAVVSIFKGVVANYKELVASLKSRMLVRRYSPMELRLEGKCLRLLVGPEGHASEPTY